MAGARPLPPPRPPASQPARQWERKSRRLAADKTHVEEIRYLPGNVAGAVVGDIREQHGLATVVPVRADAKHPLMMRRPPHCHFDRASLAAPLIPMAAPGTRLVSDVD